MKPEALALRSSAARLALWYLLILVLGVGALLTGVYWATERTLLVEVDRVVEAERQALSENFDDGGVARLVMVLNRRTDDWGRLGAVYLLVDAGGARLAGNLSAWPTGVRQNDGWLEFELDARDGGVPTPHTVRARVFPVGQYQLLVGNDMSERQRLVSRLRAATLWGSGLTTLLVAMVGWWYSRRVAGRVRAVAGACETIISGDLTQRLPGNGSGDEFDQLTTAVNHMLDRVEHQTTVLRTTFGSAAHDLRTPLQRIRARLDSLLPGDETGGTEPQASPLHEAVSDLDRIQRTLSTLLQIANAESGVAQQLQPLDLVQLAHELIELYAPVARTRRITLEVGGDPAAEITGNRQLLAQLLVNLLENALKYSPDGGRVVVRATRQGSGALLEVSDQGRGIPPAQRDAALLPFRRLESEPQVPGSGLGLSLVDAVVRLHGGRLQLDDNAPGLIVRCEFPAATPKPA